MPIRATSDGGHFVQYSAQASPVPAHEAKPEPPSVMLVGEVPDARRHTRTVLTARLQTIRGDLTQSDGD